MEIKWFVNTSLNSDVIQNEIAWNADVTYLIHNTDS